MAEAGKNGGEKGRDSASDALPTITPELIERLDRQIEELRQRAPSGYDETVIALREVMDVIHDAIGGPTFTKRR